MLTEVKLGSIDCGGLLERADAELARICEDVAKRPTLKKARVVTLQVEITPDFDVEKQRNFPRIDWKVKHQVPGHSGMTTKAFVDSENRVMMSTNDPFQEMPGQQNLLDAMEADERGPRPVEPLQGNGTE